MYLILRYQQHDVYVIFYMQSLQPSTNRFFFQIYEESLKEYHRTKGESVWVVVDRTTFYGATSNSGAAIMQT